MMTGARMLCAMMLALTLAACASTGGDSRFVRSLADVAQPSDIVATELAFARAARDDGYAKAYARFAADDAIMFDQDGPKLVSEYLASQTGDIGTFTWDVRHVYMSCDGSHAASLGTFSHPTGIQGIYTTIWERRKNGEYRIILDFPEVGKSWNGPDDVVGTTVAECRDSAPQIRGELFEPIRFEMARDASAKSIKLYQGISPDKSFGWFAAHASAADRGVMLGTFTNGNWAMMVGQRKDASEADVMSQTPSALPQ